jgi:hypothetical protein
MTISPPETVNPSVRRGRLRIIGKFVAESDRNAIRNASALSGTGFATQASD